MIKLIIFDLDGVLIDSKDAHFVSLNNALRQVDEKYVISKEQHLSSFDGRSTTVKLEKLHDQRGLPKQLFTSIWQSKQRYTIQYLKGIQKNYKLISIFEYLKENNYKVGIASNAIRKTVEMAIYSLGLQDYVDSIYSNEDCKKPKPSSLMYLKAIIDFQVQPYQTLILQDSHIGRKSAINSGAHLMQIQKLSDVTLQNIQWYINKYTNEGIHMKQIKWNAKNTNVLIPMAGRGSRFQKEGYTFPKPLIQVNGKPMIQLVVENLNIQANFIYIVRKQHYEKYNLYYLLNLLTPNCKIMQVDEVTEGAACTTLLAKQFIDNDNHLVIANSDQYIQWQSNEFFYSMTSPGIDGGILTFQSTHPKWSFVKLDQNGYVSEVAEKKPISNLATVGIYYWNRGSDYVRYAQQMIEKDIRVNNEFYVCPVYNEAIMGGKKIKTFNIKKMWGLGTPQDLHYFLQNNREQ